MLTYNTRVHIGHELCGCSGAKRVRLPRRNNILVFGLVIQSVEFEGGFRCADGEIYDFDALDEGCLVGTLLRVGQAFVEC